MHISFTHVHVIHAHMIATTMAMTGVKGAVLVVENRIAVVTHYCA